MADLIYNSFFTDLSKGNIDLDTDTFKLMLVTSAYTPTKTHAKRSDITNEVTGTGYTAGGATLANVTVTQDNTNDLAKFDADDVSWATSTITARGAVLYKARGGAASADELVKYFDFGSDQSSVGAAFTVQFNANGILQIKNGS
jgi:deoxyribose-phosphate aldolase